MIPLFLLHPQAVHFPIAILTVGFVAQAASLLFKNEGWLAPAVSWMLWVGTACAWVAVGLGLLAARTVPHVPAAWEVLYHHKQLGLWTAGSFTVLSLARPFFKNQRGIIFALLWAAGLALLFATADHGGDLVYGFGVGIVSH
jgi:uncharacterized membrane protein